MLQRNIQLTQADSYAPLTKATASVELEQSRVVTATTRTMSRNRYSTFTFALRTRRARVRHTVDTCVTVATACEVERRGLLYFECAHSCLAATVYTSHCVPLACRGHGIFGNVCAFACRGHPLPVIQSLSGSVPLMAAACHSFAHAGRIHQLQLLEFFRMRVHGSRVRLRMGCTW